MITRRKIEKMTISWHVILLSIFFILFLSTSVIFAYWYLFGSKKIESFNSMPKGNQKVYIYPKHTLTNVIKDKLLQAN